MFNLTALYNRFKPLLFALSCAIMTFTFSMIISTIFIMPSAFAQDQLALNEAILQIVALFQEGSLKGMALAMVIVQAGMILMKTKLQDKTGKYKLLVMAVLSLASSLLTNLVAGNSLAMILTDTVFIYALSNAGHQVYKQFIEKKD